MVFALPAILFSGVLLAWLAMRDPKRLRSVAHVPVVSGTRWSSLPALARRLCGVLLLVPGVLLGVAGQWWPFLIWLGAICALGWIVSLLLARRAFRAA